MAFHFIAIIAVTTALASAQKQQQIQRKSCSAQFPSTTAHLDCADISFPLNWKDTDNGESITLALNRRRCTHPENSLGYLVYNPGGPGASALQAVGTDGYFTDRLMSRWDIVGMDPRGVGQSSPIQCDPDLYNRRTPEWPQNESEYRELVFTTQALAQSCLERSGEIVRYVDSGSVARDLEAVRLALGEEKLNYFGLSYGTLYGEMYAQLFPDRVGRMLLDAVVDFSPGGNSDLVEESIARETEFPRFIDWCNNSTQCSLHGKDVGKVFDTIVAKGNETPIPAPGCNETTCKPNVTGDEFNLNANKYLHLRSTWPPLAQSLLYATNGNATALSNPVGSPASPLWQGNLEGCLDLSHTNSNAEDFKYQQAMTAAIAPRTSGQTATHRFGRQCVGWPFESENPPQVMKFEEEEGKKLQPILLVNALYDPQTSYAWAVNIHRQIPNSILLTRDGDGYGSYMLHGETTAAMDAFLINGTLPAQNDVLKT